MTFGITSNAQEKKEFPIYTIAVNVVPESFDFPLIGYVNLAKGSHKNAHIGFINWNQDDFLGCQLSFINTIGGSLIGTQIGFINTALDSVKGLQLGFINTTPQKTNGAQIGFINTSIKGSTGTQIGFVNTTKNLNGFQLGFINISDTIQKGVPFGLLSIVKKGGYRAIEISSSEMFPINLSYKMGVKKLYTSFVASYSPNTNEYLAVGIGFGSILPISKYIYLNPEVLTQNEIINDEGNQLYSIVLNTGFCISSKIHLSLGPSLVWNNAAKNENLYKEFFSIKKWEMNERNNLLFGARISIKYVFTDFKCKEN